MKNGLPLIFVPMIVASLALAGCTPTAPEKTPKAGGTDKPAADGKLAKIQAALDKLPAEDRKLAEAQQWCAVQNSQPLGTMGTPVKLTVKDQPVFLCCEHCRDKALADPEKTLARVEELKKKHSALEAK